MTTLLHVLRWIFFIPAALMLSDMIGTALALLLLRFRAHVVTMMIFFSVGVAFVCIGLWIAPSHSGWTLAGLALAKAWIDGQRGPGSPNSKASTSGAVCAALAINFY